MKVLNLRCEHDHAFEGWFASEDDFQDQAARGVVACPLCSSPQVHRLPSAPRLNLSGARAPAEPSAPAETPARAVPEPAALQALWLEAVAQVLKNTEDVGDRFPEEARRIHYGETGQRGIRGLASPDERAALADEGIEVVALPLPAARKGPAH
jgi:hypothetical protein